MDGVKLLVVGRSSQIEKSIMQPISELGLEHDVILAGYRINDYFSIISTFDLCYDAGEVTAAREPSERGHGYGKGRSCFRQWYASRTCT